MAGWFDSQPTAEFRAICWRRDDTSMSGSTKIQNAICERLQAKASIERGTIVVCYDK